MAVREALVQWKTRDDLRQPYGCLDYGVGFSVLSNATVFLAPVGFCAVFLATSAAWLRLSRMATMVSLRLSNAKVCQHNIFPS
jgi:hypothetical protein